MWQPWLAFIKEKKAPCLSNQQVAKTPDPDCLWSIQDRIFNSTVESRLKSSASADCLCQVPTETTRVGEDGEEVPVTDPSVHKPHIGKFCDAMWMDFTIDGKELVLPEDLLHYPAWPVHCGLQEVRSSGYCEWELHPAPRLSGNYVPPDPVFELYFKFATGVVSRDRANTSFCKHEW
ncbi:unnamed protein product [Symbiodinium sp. KB8]|nr:unnamed protein product [Symbiodinium sp. KB8]